MVLVWGMHLFQFLKHILSFLMWLDCFRLIFMFLLVLLRDRFTSSFCIRIIRSGITTPFSHVCPQATLSPFILENTAYWITSKWRMNNTWPFRDLKLGEWDKWQDIKILAPGFKVKDRSANPIRVGSRPHSQMPHLVSREFIRTC